jgi:hypothetical protein
MRKPEDMIDHLGKIPVEEVSEPFMIGPVNRDKILDAASDLINGDRAVAYGDALEMHRRIAAGWSEIVGVNVTPAQAALCMAWVKISRLVETPDHLDSFVDLVAYGALAGEIQYRDPKKG